MPDTYPTPAYPSTASITALDGTADESTGLDYIAIGTGPNSSPTLGTLLHRYADRLHEIVAMVNQLRVVKEATALKIGVYPGDYTLGGAHKRFTGAEAQSVTNSATNYVYIDSSNALVINTSGYPVDITTFVPLATVTAAGGVVTNVNDDRGHVGFVVPTATTSSDTGTDEVSFILDASNAGAENDSALKFNRGSTAADAQLEWDSGNGRFNLESELSGPTLATLNLLSILISGTTMLDSNGAAKVAAAVAGDGLDHTSGVLSVGTATSKGTGIDGDDVSVAASDGVALDGNGVTLNLVSGGGLELTGTSPNKALQLKAGESNPTHQANYDAADGGGIPFLVKAQLVSGNTVSIYSSSTPFKLTVVDAWAIAESADGGTWYVDNGSSAITDTVTVASTDTSISRAGQINDANATLNASSTLRVVGDGVNADVTVWIMCVRVA